MLQPSLQYLAFVFLFCLLAPNGFAQPKKIEKTTVNEKNYSPTPADTLGLSQGFVLAPVPDKGSVEARALNRSIREYAVTIENGQLLISEAEESDSCILKLERGVLVGEDHGEWGGTLRFQPYDLNEKEVEIMKGNIVSIFFFQGKIYFLEGLAHLSHSDGALYELIEEKGAFSLKKQADFDDAPEVAFVDDDRILIAGSSSFYVVSNISKKRIVAKEIAKDAFWSGLYPNSLALQDENNVLIGMRGGFVQLNLNSKKMKLYTKPK